MIYYAIQRFAGSVESAVDHKWRLYGVTMSDLSKARQKFNTVVMEGMDTPVRLVSAFVCPYLKCEIIREVIEYQEGKR